MAVSVTRTWSPFLRPSAASGTRTDPSSGRRSPAIQPAGGMGATAIDVASVSPDAVTGSSTTATARMPWSSAARHESRGEPVGSTVVVSISAATRGRASGFTRITSVTGVAGARPSSSTTRTSRTIGFATAARGELAAGSIQFDGPAGLPAGEPFSWSGYSSLPTTIAADRSFLFTHDTLTPTADPSSTATCRAPAGSGSSALAACA